MNRNTYLLGIFFISVSVVAGIFQSIILLLEGFSFIFLQSFANWYLLFNLVNLIAYGFVLRYFYFKQWQFVFITSVIAMIFFVAQFTFQYYILITVARELAVYYFIISVLSILSSIVSAAGLLFTTACHVKLLKALGVLMIVHAVMFLMGLFASNLRLPPDVGIKALIWLTASSSLLPVLYIFVFVQEMKTVSNESAPSASRETFQGVFGYAGMIMTVLLLIVGAQLGTESYWSLNWQNRAQTEARKLAQRFDSRVYVNRQGDTLQFLLMKPLNYDSTQKYPMVTCLHGGPTRVAGNIEVTQPAPLLSEPENRKKHPAFLFVPQGRPGVLWGGIPNIPSMDSLVFDAMSALEKEFSIDQKRRYVAGISGGGYGSWHFICSRPDMFAAAIPICGAGNPELAKAIVDVPVWAFHGDADRNVPVSGSRNMVEAIRKAGGNPKYNEFSGVGHNVWPEVSKTEGVLDWLFAQRRR